jgi:hypothetical protein
LTILKSINFSEDKSREWKSLLSNDIRNKITLLEYSGLYGWKWMNIKGTAIAQTLRWVSSMQHT